MKIISILVLGANKEFGASLKEYFETLPDITLSGVEADFAKGLDAVAGQSPDLVLIDTVFLDMDTVDAVRRIRAVNDRTKVCLLTLFENGDFNNLVQATGVDGVVARTHFVEKFKELVDQLFAVEQRS